MLARLPFMSAQRTNGNTHLAFVPGRAPGRSRRPRTMIDLDWCLPVWCAHSELGRE